MNVHEAPPRLIVITDTTVVPEGVLVARVERLLSLAPRHGVMVQLRDNALPLRERKALGEALVRACTAHAQWFSVNDRADLAVLLGAHALHLGERGVSTDDARGLVPAGTWISRACHEPQALSDTDADAVLLSPIAAPRKGRDPLGMGALSTGVVAAHRPGIYALGGIDGTNARGCFAAGADGVAVIGAALTPDDPRPLLDAIFG